MKKQEVRIIILPTELVNKVELLRSKYPDHIDLIYTLLNKIQNKNFIKHDKITDLYINYSRDFLKKFFGQKTINGKKVELYTNIIKDLEELEIIIVNNSYSNLESKSFSKSYAIKFYYDLFKKDELLYEYFLNSKLNIDIYNIEEVLDSVYPYVSALENNKDFTFISLLKDKYNKYNSVYEKSFNYEPIIENQKEILKNDLTIEYIDLTKLKFYQLDKIKSILNKEFYAIVDTFSSRLHTNITNLSTEHRSYLRLNNEHIVEYDLVNSQSSFLARKLKQEIKFEPRITDFYVQAREGRIYDNFVYELISQGDTRKFEEIRVEVKYNFQLLYFSKKINTESFNNFCNLFKKIYPAVYNYIKIYKKSTNQGNVEFARLLQILERNYIFGDVLPKMYEQGVKVLTIHDSFVIPKSQSELFETILKENNLYKDFCFRKKDYETGVSKLLEI